MNLKSIARVTTIAALFLGACAVEPAQACVGCKDAVATGSETGTALSNGYNRSIMLMITVPMILVTVGTTMVIRAARNGYLPEL